MRTRERRHKRRLIGAQGGGSVNLISMMDILTVLLLFLLKSYVSGEVMVPPPGVRLPNSTADQSPQSSLVVAIDDNQILLGGDRVASIPEVVNSPNMEIAPLAEQLQAASRQQDELARRRGEGVVKTRAATIQGDKEIEFRVLQKVMYTLNQNGYESIALAVLQKS